jgi:hypothetical protein
MRKTMGGYGNPYNIAPKREWTTWFGYAVLLVIAAGDAAAFYQLAAKAMQDIWAPLLWILIVAFSAAATVSMHQAGEWGRASGTKERNHVPSRLWFAVILLAWLGMGTMALWFRIVSYSATPPNAASGDSLLSTVSADAGATALPISVMMFMLYLVGGATAYGIGFKMHNPAK